MRLKISAFALFLLVACLIPRTSFAGTVTLKLESTDGVDYPYAFSINGSSSLTDLSCLNNNRQVSDGESWTATDINLETLISTPGYTNSTSVGGMTIGELKDDAYLDAKYINNSSNPNYTLNNEEVQDAIWSILDGSYVYTSLATSGASKTTEDDAVQNLVSLAESTSETSAFYSQFTYYYPESWGNNNDCNPNSIPQQFLGYTPVTPEPSSLILLGTGLAGLAGAMRLRAKSSHKA